MTVKFAAYLIAFCLSIEPCSSSPDFHVSDAQMDDLFVNGVRAIEERRYDEAANCFRNAVRLHPESAAAHSNLGLSLEGLGELDDAASEFRAAIQIDSGMAEALLNLAGCYQSQGNVEKAIQSYRAYLRHSRTSTERTAVRGLIEALSAELHDADSTAVHSGTGRWAVNEQPLTVRINCEAGLDAFSEPLTRSVENALEQWTKATSGHLRFAKCASGERSDIVIIATQTPSIKSSDNFEHGHTDLNRIGTCIKHARICINTASLPSHDSEALYTVLTQIALHEIGHALGLDKHSNNPRDVMFYCLDSPLVSTSLTSHDIAIMRQLYGLPIGGVMSKDY